MIKTLIAVLSIGAAQVASTPVAVEKEPFHHVVLENEYARVFFVEVPVGQQTLMHEHKRDYIFVCIGAADVENTPQGQKSVRLQFADGSVRFVKTPFTHMAKNLADKPFQNVTIEILKDAEAEAKPSASEITIPETPTQGTTVSKNLKIDDVLENDKVIVKEQTLNSDATLGPHTHKWPHLVVALSELHLVSTPYSLSAPSSAKGPGKRIDVQPGAVQWIAAGVTHSLSNVGPQPARFISVEFK